MKDLISVIYEKFLMRDIVGKLSPGFLVTISVLYLYSIQNKNVAFPEIQEFLWIVWIIFPLSYVIGIALQIIGQFLGLHWSAPRPRFILFVPVYKQVTDDMWDRHIKFRDSEPGKIKQETIAYRERLIYFKESAGNHALALALVAIVMNMTTIMPRQSIIFIEIASVLLLLTHITFAYRQAYLEIGYLLKTGELGEDEAKKMRGNIPGLHYFR